MKFRIHKYLSVVTVFTALCVIAFLTPSIMAIAQIISWKYYFMLMIIAIALFVVCMVMLVHDDLKQKKSPSDGNPKGDKEK